MAVRRSPKPLTGVRFLGQVPSRRGGIGRRACLRSMWAPLARVRVPPPRPVESSPSRGFFHIRPPRAATVAPHRACRVKQARTRPSGRGLPKGKFWSSADLTGNQARLTLRASRESFLDTRPSSAYKAHRPASPRPWIHGPVLESSQSPPSVHRPGDHIPRLGRRSHCILFLE